jgi:hypothetical protein
MAPDSARTPDRPPAADAVTGGIPLIDLVLSGALRIHPPERERSPEPPRDD